MKTSSSLVHLDFDSPSKRLRLIFSVSRIDSSNEPEIRIAMEASIQSFMKTHSVRKLEFSFINIDFIDSVGMKLLVYFWKYVGEHYEIPLVFTHCSPKIINYFKLCKIHHVVSINEQDDIGSSLKS